MNRKISSRWALILIVVLALVTITFSLKETRNIDRGSGGINLANINTSPKKGGDACKNKAYQGMEEIRIKVWQTIKNDKRVLQVAKGDVSKLPGNNTEDFQLIDPTPELEEEIATSSEESPVEVSLSGFAILCNGARLASLNYEDGVFRPYIN